MEEPSAVQDDTLLLPLLSEDAEGADSPGTPRGATLCQTCFNLLNIFVGMGLLSMPFALSKGGWAALAALGVLVPLFATSGQLICAAFDLMPSGSQKSYPNLGSVAAGSLGRRAVLSFAILELFGANVVTLMISWQMLELLLPTEGVGPLHPMQLAASISVVVLLPLLFISLRRLSRFSMLGSLSTSMVVCLVMSLLVLDPHRTAMPEQPPPTRHAASLGIIQSLGIFALSCSAHTTLPALRSSMQKPARFPVALAISFGFMLACYCSIAAAGYWYWGDSASPLVTTDLAVNSYYSFSRLPMDRVLAILVLVSGLTKFPGLNMILQDMVLCAWPAARDALGNGRPPRPAVKHTLRLALFAAAAVVALTVYESLGSVLSLVGGLCSLTCSLLLPAAFYTRLAWPRLHTTARLALSAMLVLSVVLIITITATNLSDMLGHRDSTPRGAADERSSFAAHLGLIW